MASLRDAEQLTKDLEETVGKLKKEIREGKGDFEKLATLADEVSEHADKVAETFSSMNDVLSEPDLGAERRELERLELERLARFAAEVRIVVLDGRREA